MQFYYFYGVVLIVAAASALSVETESTAPARMTDVSVVIVSYESRDLLARCLGRAWRPTGSGVRRSRRSSSTRPRRTARRRGSRPSTRRCVSSPSTENVGFGAGNNRGAAVASGRWLLLLNSDAFVRPGALDELVRFAEARHGAGAVGPRLLWPDGRLQRSCRRFPTVFRIATEYLYLRKLAPHSRILNGFYYGEFAHDEARRVDWVTGACVLLRRELFERLGGFDEAFFLYSEEVDLLCRASSLGAETWYDPAAEVEHVWGGTAGRSSALTLQEQARSHVRYLVKHALARCGAARAPRAARGPRPARPALAGAPEAARWLARRPLEALLAEQRPGPAPTAQGPGGVEPLPWPGARPQGDLLGVARRPRVDARAVPGLRRACWRGSDRARHARTTAYRPRVALVIAAYNEHDVIAAKLENALALDYPPELLRIVVASDASSDGTDEIVQGFAERGVELVRAPRGGKVNAQNVAVRTLGDVDVVAFSDANCQWQPDALRTARRAARRCARRVRLRAAAAALARGHEPGGRVLALRDLAARPGVARALRDRRQRLDLRRAARALRGGRPALRP